MISELKVNGTFTQKISVSFFSWREMKRTNPSNLEKKLERSMRRSEFVSDCVDSLYYKLIKQA